MQFIALDVNVGDSFILKQSGKVFVVDGGRNQKDIVQKLKKNQIKDINVLICTHYDDDHLNGIIGIIKSSTFSVEELWLPDIFGDIALTLSEDSQIVHYFFSEEANSNYNNAQKATLDNYLEKREKKEENEEGKVFDISYLEYIQKQMYCFCPLFISRFLNYKYAKKIAKILELIIAACYSGAKIRWLKYRSSLNRKKISGHFELFALNSFETVLQAYTRQTFYYALAMLSVINIESLVFQYTENNFPDILFTADSDLCFCGQNNILLPDNSIVTAPHHGSSTNSHAYTIVQGNNLIYVRCSSKTVPCKEFVCLPVKYCTICYNTLRKEKVMLNYSSIKQKWESPNGLCCNLQSGKP